MATDAEESDTEEHEKPGPAKRQKIPSQRLERELQTVSIDMLFCVLERGFPLFSNKRPFFFFFTNTTIS